MRTYDGWLGLWKGGVWMARSEWVLIYMRVGFPPGAGKIQKRSLTGGNDVSTWSASLSHSIQPIAGV